jgi:hypothetical protein
VDDDVASYVDDDVVTDTWTLTFLS